MYSLKKWLSLEVAAALLALLLVFLLLGKIKVGEYAEGFYVVRPTWWLVTPTEVNVEFTSFYPSTLTCEVNVFGSVTTVTVEPRESFYVSVPGNFRPNTLVKIPVMLDCGVVRERGEIAAYVFLT